MLKTNATDDKQHFEVLICHAVHVWCSFCVNTGKWTLCTTTTVTRPYLL